MEINGKPVTTDYMIDCILMHIKDPQKRRECEAKLREAMAKHEAETKTPDLLNLPLNPNEAEMLAKLLRYQTGNLAEVNRQMATIIAKRLADLQTTGPCVCPTCTPHPQPIHHHD